MVAVWPMSRSLVTKRRQTAPRGGAGSPVRRVLRSPRQPTSSSVSGSLCFCPPSSDGEAELQSGSPAPPRHTGLTEPGAQVLLKPESTLLCTEHLKVKKDSEAIMIFIL